MGKKMHEVIEFKPPGNINRRIDKPSREFRIFLAGTIDMGDSEDWQSKIRSHFIGEPNSGVSNTTVIIYNPRRDEWNKDWKQEFSDPNFYQQVNWELNALEKSDLVILNILPDSKSPISLLELGIFAKSGKIKVCCPKGFYRKGNVDVVCDRYDIPLYHNMEDLLNSIQL